MPTINYNYKDLVEKVEKLRKQLGYKQVKYSNGPLTGPVTCCNTLGVDYNTGIIYYKDIDGNWQPISGGSGGGDLQHTLDAGNTANDQSITLTNSSNSSIVGLAFNHGLGSLVLSNDGFISRIYADNATANRDIEFPNFTGTLVGSVNGVSADAQGNVVISGGSLTYKQIGFGDSSNALSGSSAFLFDPTLNQVRHGTDGTNNPIHFLVGSGSRFSVAETGLGRVVNMGTDGMTGIPYIGFSGSPGTLRILYPTITANRDINLPNASGMIPLTVNGQTADSVGNITVATGGSPILSAQRIAVGDGSNALSDSIDLLIDNSGGAGLAKVGINNDTPTEALDVLGNVLITTLSNGPVHIAGGEFTDEAGLYADGMGSGKIMATYNRASSQYAYAENNYNCTLGVTPYHSFTGDVEIQGNLIVDGNKTTTAYDINIPDYFQPSDLDVLTSTHGWMIIDPPTPLTAITIALPSSPTDGQLLSMSFTQSITTLTWTGGTVDSKVPLSNPGPTPINIGYSAILDKWLLK